VGAVSVLGGAVRSWLPENLPEPSHAVRGHVLGYARVKGA
jgi:hypothetical protein